MIAVLVTFQYGDEFDANRVRAVAEKAAPQFENMPGLRSKVFTLDEQNRRAQNFYLWDSTEAGTAFFSDEVRQLVTGLYGVPPSIDLLEVAAVVENA